MTGNAIPEHLKAAYDAERRRRTIEAAWAVNIIALCMYPVTTLLDLFVASPEYVPLSIVRFSETGALVAYLLLLWWMRRTGRAERWANLLAWGLAIVIVVSLDLFTIIMGGPESIYYNGLNLLLTAVLVAYPWTLGHTALLVGFLVVQSNLAFLAFTPDAQGQGYFVANYFYVGISFIGLFWRAVGERLQRSEFLQRKEAEAGHARLAAALDSIGDGVLTTDTGGRVSLMNRVASDLTGWSPEEAEGQPLGAVYRALDTRTGLPAAASATSILDPGVAPDPSYRLASLPSRTGGERTVEQRAAPILDGESSVLGVALAFRDVTERHRMEEELQRAHKLESVGLLAGGIAHDFNNLLTSILGSITLARSDHRTEPVQAGWLGEAERAVMRARDLTHQLLTFSKGGAPIRRPSRLGELISDSAVFSLRGSNARCDLAIPDDLWAADVDPGQFSQVISNLVINAAEAMPGGGTVRISAMNLPDGAPLPPSLPGGPFVRISVEDAGVGIAPEALARVFDPFFTTKTRGRGLGLSICFSILRKHDGAVTVDSRPGQGATFHVFLPASERLPSPRVVEPEPTAPRVGRALIMDDNPSVLAVSRELLARLGWEVVTVADGAAAVEAYRTTLLGGRPFDVVILDLTVPGGMGGKEAAARLLEIDRDAWIVVSSGYSNDPVMSEYRSHGFCGVIPKPWELSTLDRMLREAPRRSAPGSPVVVSS